MKLQDNLSGLVSKLGIIMEDVEYGEFTLKDKTVKETIDFLSKFPEDTLVELYTRYFDGGKQESFIFFSKK